MKLKYFILLLVTFILCACSVTKYIPEDEKLYTGASFEINPPKKKKDLETIEQELQAVLWPKPNDSKLGLLAHYKVEKGDAGFLYKFINKKLGQEPVYQSDVDVPETEKLIINRLENLGFFYSTVISKRKEKAKKSSVVYDVNLQPPYVMETYQLATDSLSIYKEIKNSLPRASIKKGDRFNLTKLKIERERIDSHLKSKGYYNFNADFLIFEIDTNRYSNKRYDLFLRLKNNVQKRALIPYRLDTINVYPNYTIKTNESNEKTTKVKGINFVQDTVYFKPLSLRPYILFKEGQLYNPQKFKNTSRRLSSINAYKFVNVTFDEQPVSPNDTVGYLNTNIQLSPLKKRALNAELQANLKSNGFTGPSLGLSYTNRNLFKAGEVLKITGDFGYEAQFGNNAGISSTQFGLTGSLVFPRLLFPIKISKPFRYNMPKTIVSAGVEFLNRSEYYSLSSFNTTFGYQLRSSPFVSQTLNPISTSFIKLGNSSEAFDTILEENPYLQSSFEQQLISGLTYSFTYNELGTSSKKNPIYLNANIDVAGNSLSLVGATNEETGKKTIFGVEFAQYAKMDADFRYYLNLGKEQVLVSRLYGGYGYAYGNSDVLPYSKQFFSGGPYSIRAFATRSIGPGSYSTEDTDSDSYFDRSGDIKLEANIEYRFPIYSFLKGAVFADAGNVWLRDENTELVGGKFTSNFMNELAIGAGVGLRVDIQSFVIRLDWAAPVHTPDIEQQGNYTFDANNGIFNFAIGYPF